MSVSGCLVFVIFRRRSKDSNQVMCPCGNECNYLRRRKSKNRDLQLTNYQTATYDNENHEQDMCGDNTIRAVSESSTPECASISSIVSEVMSVDKKLPHEPVYDNIDYIQENTAMSTQLYS